MTKSHSSRSFEISEIQRKTTAPQSRESHSEIQTLSPALEILLSRDDPYRDLVSGQFYIERDEFMIRQWIAGVIKSRPRLRIGDIEPFREEPVYTA